MSGKFITIEGVEGCGKSTQVVQLKHDLESKGHAVEVTREPGGTPVGEAIRRILLDPDYADMSPTTELLLYAAARAQHVAQRIRPALEAGRIVLCDRFADSTTAYQGAGRQLSEDIVRRLHEIATSGVWPDLTIVLDLPVEVGLARATRRTAPDRLETEPLAFHRRVREEFLRLARSEPSRIKVIDGDRAVDDVTEDIWRLVVQLLENE